MWQKAIEDALGVTKRNILRFGDRFPHVSTDGEHYTLNDNTEWTAGFWSGILWLCSEYSEDPVYREQALRTVRSFRHRMDHKIIFDHHDIGFLYSLSSKAQWIIEQDTGAAQLTLEAADMLMKRWREAAGLIQAWGPEGDSVNGGRIIIDCLLNLPLLLWAHEHTGVASYRRVAELHARKARRFLVRGDGSSYHTFYFDPATGDAIRGGTHQGYGDGSTWTRGQAWGIYGFALISRYLQSAEMLETAKQLGRYFVSQLPEDGVAYWDFDAPVGPDTKRDSSASAIAACGLLEIAAQLGEADPEYRFFREAAEAAVRALAEHYSTHGSGEAEGLLKHGSYSVRAGDSPDDYTIWGDYYYLEALMRLERDIPGYWYERS
ncbi:glucuronyl hydrolase [Paenibacillus sp. FSL P4-0081]|jgi:unsaturated chondroitin disaccharide hydrolase|uniref:glycoside hydrolase family 88 protein n=2 Tax=Paenibacillus TaxID=44249 RepID=UPI0004F728B6|nr:glycoside hydrolase family 88 protein [Paenibacillus sp. FSL P4-0081]AIQ27018.1 glucuronyl hydrolase [Paenibacillus sp. FSL P4-0081]